MNTTLEDKLFAEFKPQGAAALCLRYVMDVILSEDKALYNEPKEWKDFYDSIPATVAERTKAFDDTAWPLNVRGEYRIAQEISDNLDEFTSDNKRERYIIRILEVFEDWARVYTPIAQIQTLEQAILRHDDDDLYSVEEYQESIEQLKEKRDKLYDLINSPEHGEIIKYFKHWHRAYHFFCDMLAAELAKHNINLLEIQNKRGIWLVEKLDVVRVQTYFRWDGNYNYANALLRVLPASDSTLHLITFEDNGIIRDRANKHSFTINLPDELNTERAKTYFTKAFESNLITIKNGKWKWEHSKVLLELFCGMVYCSDAIKPSRFGNKWIFGKGEIFPSAPLGRLFGEANLGQQRLNYRDGDNSRSAPRGWEIIAEIFE